MASDRFSHLVEQLVKMAPITQVGFALLLTGSSLAFDLPKAEFGKAIGSPTSFLASAAVANKSTAALFDDFGSNGDFVASLLGAVIFDLTHVVVTMLLLLLVGASGLWLRSRRKRPLEDKAGERLAVGTMFLLLFLVTAVALLTPKYTAPSHLDGIAARLASHESFRDQSRWLGVVRPEIEHFKELYSWLHGVDPETPAAVDNVRAPPTAAHFQKVKVYYSQLARYTIWSLLVLLALSFLASSTLSGSQAGALRRNVLSFLLLLATFVHLFQWFWLAADYGRLRVVANVLEVGASPLVGQIQPVIISQWPFLTPELTFGENEEIYIRNLWPLDDPAGEFGLAVTATIMDERGQPRNSTMAFTREQLGELAEGSTRLNLDLATIRRQLQLGDAETLIRIRVHDGQGTANRNVPGT